MPAKHIKTKLIAPASTVILGHLSVSVMNQSLPAKQKKKKKGGGVGETFAGRRGPQPVQEEEQLCFGQGAGSIEEERAGSPPPVLSPFPDPHRGLACRRPGPSGGRRARGLGRSALSLGSQDAPHSGPLRERTSPHGTQALPPPPRASQAARRHQAAASFQEGVLRPAPINPLLTFPAGPAGSPALTAGRLWARPPLAGGAPRRAGGEGGGGAAGQLGAHSGARGRNARSRPRSRTGCSQEHAQADRGSRAPGRLRGSPERKESLE
jgi:hypothetical protein